MMEFIGSKRRRKRNRRRHINGRRRSENNKFDIKSIRPRMTYNIDIKSKRNVYNTMDASAFWQNYKTAHEWQKTHNVTWWKTRCFALEYENSVLRQTIRDLVKNINSKNNSNKVYQNKHQYNVKKTDDDLDDQIQFCMNQDMMDFLTQSIKHKIELKNKREVLEATEEVSEEAMYTSFESVRKRSEDAKLLYGAASSKVLAMETALQTTIERHIDKTKPQYWPNIPLKL